VLARPKPVAGQLREILRKRILDGYYPSDRRLPSENELAVEFGVSRSSIRSAFYPLVAEALVVRRPGYGTFVNQRLLEFTAKIGSLWEYSRNIEATGRKPSVKTISVARRPATPPETSALGLQSDDEVLCVENLVLADQNPAALVYNVFPVLVLAHDVDLQDASVPLDEFIKSHCRRRPSYVLVEVSATIVQGAAAQALGLQDGSPSLLIDATFFDEGSRPVANTVTYYADKGSPIRVPIMLE
jgi:DNA-binding GntR family transcriptional regulator